MLPEFNNQQLLITALSHRSSLNEVNSGTTATESYERLEFLGDAVLELVTTEFLFEQFPDEPEGVLTSYRSSLVKTTTLAQVARELKLGEKMFMSKGEEATGGRENDGLLADVFEAVIGALYLDQGFKAVKQFLAEQLFPKFAEIKSKRLYRDSKSLLQEVVQAKGLPTPVYDVIAEQGPDHDKTFTVEVKVNNQVVGKGTGKSKQLAQQEAASQALERFDV
ncbi:MAG: ribonuclease III [Patescibacteria group bacterium]